MFDNEDYAYLFGENENGDGFSDDDLRIIEGEEGEEDNCKDEEDKDDVIF